MYVRMRAFGVLFLVTKGVFLRCFFCLNERVDGSFEGGICGCMFAVVEKLTEN